MQKNIPYHLGIIMDGNRRWAKERGLATLEGHKKGYDKLVELGRWAREAGVKVITVYAFSTENWKRTKKEVGYLMGLFKLALTRELKKFIKDGVRLKVIGKVSGLPKDLRAAVKKAEKATQNLKEGTLNLAINYGGRLEIMEAVKKLIRAKKPISEKNISENLWTAGQKDPDLVIRTSGEQRLSGFLTWQSVYSELVFVKCHWPAFSKKDFDYCLNEYAKRQRRFGGN